MEGKVKWFSKDKGYGFITGLDNVDRYFNESSVEGGEIPNAGDSVLFDEKQGIKGPQAIGVKIVGRYNPGADDDRVLCGSCGRRMVPLVIIEVNWRGRKQPYHSVCPYCGTKYMDFNTGCFIATAVYGGHDSPETLVLRRFRDRVLMRSATGRTFVSAYYKMSPAVAAWLERCPGAKRPVRYLLTRLVALIERRPNARTNR